MESKNRNVITIQTTSKSYEIHFSNQFSEILSGAFGKKKYIILTEKGLPEEIRSKICSIIEKISLSYHVIVLDQLGEENKSLSTFECIIQDILMNTKVTRDTILIALGGGVIGDLGGFIASTLMRGIGFVQIPTTLLSMVDSSIGGKTALNGFGYKNIIGTFYQPDLVICNTDFLATLPYNTYISGYSEIFKHAIIQDSGFLQFLVKSQEEIKLRNPAKMQGIIAKSCEIKANIVSQDETEQLGIRTFLNLGHTIAHAIEKLTSVDKNILHGMAVGCGIVMELKIAEKIGLLKDNTIIQITQEHFEYLQIPTKLNQITKVTEKTIDEMLSKMSLDKKNLTSDEPKIAFSLPSEIGIMHNVHIKLNELKSILSNLIS